MCGNGYGIGMRAIIVQLWGRRTIQREQSPALTVCGAAGVGTVQRRTLVRRIGSTVLPATGAAITAFGFCSLEKGTEDRE